jgi:hypothetical protein
MILASIIVRVQNAVDQLGTDCSMEEVVQLCPELTRNQVFLAIDDLSRTGLVRVALGGDGLIGCGPIAPSQSQLRLRHQLPCKSLWTRESLSLSKVGIIVLGSSLPSLTRYLAGVSRWKNLNQCRETNIRRSKKGRCLWKPS